jgi:class 3 adenylate cyclase
MADNSNRTLVCSVLFIDIVGYSKKGVGDQVRLKQNLTAVLTSALEQVPPRERVVVDTGDGAAVTFLGDPEGALFCGLAVLDKVGEIPVRMGINLGPVSLMKDINGLDNVIGDGINVAERVMSFADPGQILVSRSFYEVASRLSDEYGRIFKNEGERMDKHVREHEVYSVADGVVARRAAGSLVPRPSADDAGAAAVSEPAKIFDAGENLIITGYSRSSVQEALDQLKAQGAAVMSEITQHNNKWMASCEHPAIQMSGCKVEEMGSVRIVTGPTRAAVTAKVEELAQFGAVLTREIECTADVWIAVCESRR